MEDTLVQSLKRLLACLPCFGGVDHSEGDRTTNTEQRPATERARLAFEVDDEGDEEEWGVYVSKMTLSVLNLSLK